MPKADRRQRFVNAYLGEAAGNASKAAVLAGYSDKAARQIGSRLLTYADVRQAIDAKQQALAEQSGMTAEKVITELATLAQVTPDKVTASDKIKALELLGKAHGLFKDVSKGEGRITVNIGFLTPQSAEPRTIEVIAK